MFQNTIYTCIMMLSAKQFLRWRNNLKKEKMKVKIEALSNEWEQLTQYLMVLEQKAFQDHQRYDSDFNYLQAKIAQLGHCKESYEDVKHVLLELVSTEDASPKEFQTISSEFFEVMCELNRLQKETSQLQEQFDSLYQNREQTVNQHLEMVKELKTKILQIETELSNLRLSS